MKNILFQTFAEAGDGAFVTDKDQRIIFWNPAAAEITGYTHDEVAGLPCYEVLEGRDEQGRLIRDVTQKKQLEQLINHMLKAARDPSIHKKGFSKRSPGKCPKQADPSAS